MEALYVEVAKEMTKLVVTRPLEQLKLVWGMKGQLEKLKEEFTYIQAFLQDVSSSNHLIREVEDPSNIQIHKAWVRRVIELAYFADDVMDDCAFETLHKRSSNNEMSKMSKMVQVPSCGVVSFKMSKMVAYQFRMSSKLDRILMSFDKLYKDAKKLGIRPAEVAVTSGFRYGDSVRTSRNNFIHQSLDEVRELAVAHSFEFVGRKSDQDELTKLLCDPNNNKEVISSIVIVGMGGLGKTTLARQLYCSSVVNDQFSETFWICVSDNFTAKRFLREMFEKLTGGNCELSNTEDIILRVQQFLRGKRYLLVLDDVWHQNQSKWNSFTNCLLRIGGSTGSTILVTTRSKDVARALDTLYIHELTGLTDVEGWTFFVQKAFPKGIGAYDPEFKEIGRRIVKKCDGLLFWCILGQDYDRSNINRFTDLRLLIPEN